MYHKRWFSSSRFALLVSWLFVATMLHGKTAKKRQAFAKKELDVWLDALEAVQNEAFVSGYETATLLKALPVLSHSRA